MHQNIQDFNRGAALIFAELYRNFPRKIFLAIADLDDGADLLSEERAARLDERAEIYVAAMEFLRDEGFIVYSDSVLIGRESTFAKVRLTSKGLAAMQRLPPTIDPSRKSIGDTLVEIARGTFTAAAQQTVQSALGVVFGG